MLIKQQLMEGVQTYVGDFLVTATDGGEYLQGKEALLLHCLRVVHSLVHLIPLVHLLVPLAPRAGCVSSLAGSLCHIVR